jgi:hypothetical protein
MTRVLSQTSIAAPWPRLCAECHTHTACRVQTRTLARSLAERFARKGYKDKYVFSSNGVTWLR